MNGDKRNFSLSIWDHKDNFICNLKSANSDFEGQSFNENFIENINGEKSLSFSIPMYIFSYDKNNNNLFDFKPNEAWKQIKNEQKIRYIEYHPITNKPEKIEEFVLKEFTETRNGEEKIAECTCESLAIYELSKVGWGITFDTNYINDYELGFHEEIIEGVSTSISNCPDLLTLDYWMKKLLYKETNLGRVSNTTECTYLLQGLQLRDNEGYPINEEIIAVTTNAITDNIEYKYNRIEEPICVSEDSDIFRKYLNLNGWSWEVKANFENDPNKQSISTLYEIPTINNFIETFPDHFMAQSYQKGITTNPAPVQLRRHPIPEEELNEWTYVTDVKKRLITEERSNLYSIIQDLCETFQVWADFQYHYSDDGKINERKILFKTEAIDEGIKFDFSYGKNLQSCSRLKNSNDLVTKLYVTNTDSNLVENGILSIQQATANPIGENYIYNFDYFYDCGILTREKDKGENSDEYKINLHCGKLRNINNKIINIQKFLTPLYDREDVLQGDLTIEEGSRLGYIDNIQSIQNKIDAIPPKDQIIKSWSSDNNQYNHVGELKTYSSTTKPGDNTSSDWFYLDFGREDILVNELENYEYHIVYNNGIPELQEVKVVNESFSTLSGFIPRIFKYDKSWYSGNGIVGDNDVSKFDLLEPDVDTCIYNYSSIGNGVFIKGIYLHKSIIGNSTYGRIRYKYAPLAYYYLLINDYWEKIGKEEIQIIRTKDNLTDIKNKIILYELQLKKLLQEKNELILQFENDYKPFIREGFWEPSDYQSQLKEETFNTYINRNNFNKLENNAVSLSTLNLNDSLFNYSYYFSLGNATQIDLDSIKMSIKTFINSSTTFIPQYQGNNYELYLSGENLICAIDPNIINDYINNKHYNISDNKDFFQTKVVYQPLINGIIQSFTTDTKDWIDNPISIDDYKIYLNKENIITDKLKVYGDTITEDESTLLVPYEDYSYIYESVGYDSNGQRKNLKEQESYSTELQYKYSLCIKFNLTNNTVKYLTKQNPIFIVKYGEETTLQYIYNDSVATSKKYSVPQVEYNISVVDLSSLNEYENYKPKLGQKVPIFDPEMNLYNVKGFITSISYNLEEKYNTELTIATYSTKFEDMFQKLAATVTNINYNNNEILKAANSFEEDGSIKTDVFRKSLQDSFEAVQLGVNNEITIDKATGITLQDNDNNAGVKLIGRGIFLTKDITKGISTEWRTGITGEGINTDALTAGSLDTKQITIWNSSEKQARFVWNEQGLFAYGDKFGESESTSALTYQELIDYNKYVRYNQEGLEFNDNGMSALSLGWQGLKIQTQNEALELNADKGLILQQWDNDHQSSTTRLELGKLDKGTLYGLRLKDTSGTTTFQSDSDGNLWLHQHIRLGGSIDENNIVQEPTAGIYGLTAISTEQEKVEVPIDMQMGIRRDDSGKVIWDNTPIRFWAGPQSRENYQNNIHITSDEITSATNGNHFDELSDNNSPSLSKFKVSANGDIIASGIDVGGWVGQGSKLRSFNNEAIMRSNGYTTTINNKLVDYPVLAIGKIDENHYNYGENYNFRVYRDGSINIGNGNFQVDKDGNIDIKAGEINIGNGNFIVDKYGNVTLNSFTINADNVGGLDNKINEIISPSIIDLENQLSNISLSTVGGYSNESNKLSSFNTNNYYVALQKPNSSTSFVFFAGTKSSTKIENNAFYIRADGYMKAASGTIGGWYITDTELRSSTSITTAYVALKAPTTDTSVVIQAGTTTTSALFKVTAKGNLTAQSGTIGGWNINGTSGISKTDDDGNATYIRPNTNNTNPVIFIGTTTGISKFTTSGSTSFAVTGKGAVYFKQGIYGWSTVKGQFKKGLSNGSVSVYSTSNKTLNVEICNGLIIDIS